MACSRLPNGWSMDRTGATRERSGQEHAYGEESCKTRFQTFDGIGQKKAAMAVELLERQLGRTGQMMEGSDIAYDVHVSRVFLRAGLADEMTRTR